MRFYKRRRLLRLNCRRHRRRSPSPPPVQATATPAASGADVYEYEPQRLEEGVRKHMLSVFVADESGLINRVAGVFARRGANIESLAVGLTLDKVRGGWAGTGANKGRGRGRAPCAACFLQRESCAGWGVS